MNQKQAEKKKIMRSIWDYMPLRPEVVEGKSTEELIKEFEAILEQDRKNLQTETGREIVFPVYKRHTSGFGAWQK